MKKVAYIDKWVRELIQVCGGGGVGVQRVKASSGRDTRADE